MRCLSPGGPASVAQGGSPVYQRGALAVALACVLAAPLAAEEPKPLARTHAHNDYEHKRPLLDALECGFTSVEADIWLVKGQLLVAHTPLAWDTKRTLEALS